jgi:transposase-like protein
MTVNPNSIDLSAFMAEHLERAEPDLLRSMLSGFIQALMSADADALCGAAYGTHTPERTNSRNGYRTPGLRHSRRHVEVAIPKLREGSYFRQDAPDPHRRWARLPRLAHPTPP